MAYGAAVSQLGRLRRIAGQLCSRLSLLRRAPTPHMHVTFHMAAVRRRGSTARPLPQGQERCCRLLAPPNLRKRTRWMARHPPSTRFVSHAHGLPARVAHRRRACRQAVRDAHSGSLPVGQPLVDSLSSLLPMAGPSPHPANPQIQRILIQTRPRLPLIPPLLSTRPHRPLRPTVSPRRHNLQEPFVSLGQKLNGRPLHRLARQYDRLPVKPLDCVLKGRPIGFL